MACLRSCLAAAAAALLPPPAAFAQAATPEAVAPSLAATPLDAVTSLGTRTELIAGDSALPVTVIDRAQILDRDLRSTTEILRDVPGVDISGAPRTTALEPTLRGLGGDRIAIRLDGARQNFNAGHRGRLFLDPDLLRSVDVLRGPASALYGSGAIGGVIGFRLIEPEDVLPVGSPNPVGATFRLGGASQGGTLRATAAGAIRAGDVSVLGAVAGLGNTNFSDGAGNTIPYTANSGFTALGRVNWSPGNHRFGLSVLGYRNANQLPIAANTATTTGITDRVTEQLTFTARWKHADPATPLIAPQLVLYRNEVSLSEQRLAGTRARDSTRLVTLGLDAQNTSRFSLFGADRHALTVGVEAYQDDQTGLSNGRARPQFPSARQDVVALYAQDELTLGRLSIVPGLRWDSFQQQSPDGLNDRTSSRLSPKVSVAYQVTGWLQPYFSYAQAFRAPSLTELYVGGQHFPGNLFVPNPNLRPETATNLEVGVNIRFADVLVPGDRLRARLTAFQNDVDDFIEQIVLRTTTVSRNVAQARLRGFEAEVQYDTGRVFGSVSASVLRGDNLTTGEPLASIPANRVALNGGYRFLEHGVVAGARWFIAAAQDRAPNLPGVAQNTPGYGVLDLYVTWTPDFAPAVRLDVGIDNVFDTAYRRATWNSNPPPPFYEVGRNIRGSMRFTF